MIKETRLVWNRNDSSPLEVKVPKGCFCNDAIEEPFLSSSEKKKKTVNNS